MEDVLSKKPLGEVLMGNKLIGQMHLAHALALQEKTGCRLGDILISHGMVGYLGLYRAVAEYHNLPFIDLLTDPPAPGLPNAYLADEYLAVRAIPWRRENSVTTVAICDKSDEVIAWSRHRIGGELRFVITSPIDIRRTVEKLFGANLEKSSRLALWKQLPLASARITMIPFQRDLLYATLITAIAVMVARPVETALALTAFCHIAYGITMLFKCWVFAAGQKPPPEIDWKSRLDSLRARDLPVYTVLIPMYREAASLPGMLEAMQRMDYPASKLDIKLVLEADDKETLDAAYQLKPRHQFEIIRVPPGEPRTKPKACNYALRFARGEFVTIFDADDRPERTQIKKAVWMFRNSPDDIICLQARLNYYNANDNWLTRFFSLEYTILFHFMLQGLERLGIPIPLGGTSNHIHLGKLKALGEWDPYNVTEDADLGTRLAARGFSTAMLDSYTMEEAPNRTVPWLKQRSRWIKGYMQTWLVHMRKPAELYRTLGLKSFTGFQFFVGFSSFTFLTAPLVWLLSILWISSVVKLHGIPFPDWLATLTLANLFLNLASHWYFALTCAVHYKRHRAAVITAALLYPLYLVLHSIASYKALWQLVFKPHFWEKTTHGLVKRLDLAQMENEPLKVTARQ